MVALAVLLGGALGTLTRAALDMRFTTPSGHFPWTTLAVNLMGSLLLGILVALTERTRSAARPHAHLVRPFLTTGVLGGFTTFSTFMVDSAQLTRGGHLGAAAGNLAVAAIGGVACALIGLRIGDRITALRRGDDT